MSDIRVGDRVRFLEKYSALEIGTEVEVTRVRPGHQDTMIHYRNPTTLLESGVYAFRVEKVNPSVRIQAVIPTTEPVVDIVNQPPHYTSHPSGIEVIEITRHMGFCLGNVVKYALRCDLKRDAVEDLRKAIKYLEFEIETRERAA